MSTPSGDRPCLNPPILINLFAGPGAGKSTTAALLFGLLKLADVRCELATEYAKDLVWEGATKQFADKTFLTMQQRWRIERLVGEVDVIITDSPILLGLIYNSDTSPAYQQWLLTLHDRFDCLDYLLERDRGVHGFQQYGREQDETAAVAIDEQIETMFFTYGLPYRKRRVAGLALAEQLRDEVMLRLVERGAA